MADAPNHPAARETRAPLALQILALAVAIAGLLAGLWLFASPVSRAFADATGLPAYWSSIGFAVAWFIAASIVLGKLRKERPEFRLPLRVAFLLTVAAVGGVFAWTSLTDDKADDDVSFAEEAVPASQMPEVKTPEAPKRNVVLSSGTFSGIDHTAEGRARIVRLASGDHRLVFTEFDVERAPDLRVYLAEDEVTGDIGPYRELDKLKGNVGDQYYELPKGIDLDRYRHVVIWCKAFDVGVAQAPLEES
jgi:Electron transfer DM13